MRLRDKFCQATKKENNEKQISEIYIGLKIRPEVFELIEKDRRISRIPRSAWVSLAIIKRLERLGYELKK